MAYARPPYESRPSPYDLERSRSTWDNMQRPHYPSMPSPSQHAMASPNLLDLESGSSDVSDTPGESYQEHVQSAFPRPIPPPLAKHLLESLETIESRLRELQHIEDENIRKHDQLKAKRLRKDDKIRRKREAQDLKIKAIMDTRARRDERIHRRRKVEDDAFDRFDQDLEEEENNLRRRQKRLKRGLPVEETGPGSLILSASMSPPGTAYSNVPPPAKRHQTGPPGQNDSPITSTPRPNSHGNPSAPNSAGPNPPPYAFLQSSHPSTSASYGHSPTISSQSPISSTSGFASTSIPRSHQPSSDAPPSAYGMNGHPPSPHASRPPIAPPGPTLNTAPPPRQPLSSYDTRPPPPLPSGFATINAPPASGFAAINPRNAATPPSSNSAPPVKANDGDRTNGYNGPYTLEGTPTGGSTSASSKRTPSTTHPYQMSEAFANRHHHCERIDYLNRGIWTSFGPGGTKEMPTGPPQEMYLRCNHDGCRRIDWRTVHGLQCHIVKNHEQPKGTIGSLEKALDRYGVPVDEIERYEEEHGSGSGGDMADPKNFKLKTKSRESTEKFDGQRRPFGTPIAANGYKSNVTMSLGNPQPYHGSPASIRSLQHEETEGSDSDSRTPPTIPGSKIAQSRASGFAAVNGTYSATPPAKSTEAREIEMKDAPRSPHSSGPSSVPKRDGPFWQSWPENLGSTRAPPIANTSAPKTTIGHSQPLSNSGPSYQPNVQSQYESTPSKPVPIQGLDTTTNHVQTTPKQNDYPAQPQIKSNQNSPTIAFPLMAQDKPVVTKPDTFRDLTTTQTSIPEPKPRPAEVQTPTHASVSTPMPAPAPAPTSTQPSAIVQEKKEEVVAAQLPQKEPEILKTESIEPPRPEPKSLENMTRRTSVIGVRSSRRSSVAAIRAEKEREKEREDAAAAAAARLEAEAEAEKEKEEERERRQKEESRNSVDGEQEQQNEKDEDQNREEDSDDPDTITAAVPSSLSKDKDRDKDRENRTTPRRTANGRFVRKR